MKEFVEVLFLKLRSLFLRTQVNPLPRSHAQLDGKKIARIWVLTDDNGKPTVVLAEGFNGELYSEPYSPTLSSLITSSGIPCQTEKASKIFAIFAKIMSLNNEINGMDIPGASNTLTKP